MSISLRRGLEAGDRYEVLPDLLPNHDLINGRRSFVCDVIVRSRDDLRRQFSDCRVNKFWVLLQHKGVDYIEALDSRWVGLRCNATGHCSN